MKITNLKINGIKDPIGYTFDHLLCSWNVEEAQGKEQTNAVIEVSLIEDFKELAYRKEGRDLKQNGEKIEMELKPRTTYYYRVTVESEAGECAVSRAGVFETGKMKEEWTGRWITTQKEDNFHPVFEKEFAVSKKVKRARLYITGVGLFEAYLDGEKIGNEYLTPYISNYESEIQVMTFPVEKYLKDQKEHKLSVILGKGWYMGTFGLELEKNNYGNKMALIGELHLEYEDGAQEIIATDDSFVYRILRILGSIWGKF